MDIGDMVRLDAKLHEEHVVVILGTAHPSAWRHSRGDRFGTCDVGIILETHYTESTVYHRILTQRGTEGWIHEIQLEMV